MYELTIHLETDGNIPIYEQIYRYIKKEIQSGRLLFNERLPSTRSLAAFLQVSRSTVELAYDQLVSEGYIEPVPCRGYYVCEIDELCCFNTRKNSVKVRKRQEKKKYSYDFVTNGIDLNGFPFSIWRKLMKSVLTDEKKELIQLGDSQGEFSLRQTIAAYLHQARGVACRPEQIVVGAGLDYLFMILSRILGTDRRIAMENPTYRHSYEMFLSLGYTVDAVGMDRDGILMDDLYKSEAQLVYVMPSHQFPVGIVMPVKRRAELLRWANEDECRYIIEDDYDSEFRYKGKPIPALQGNDRNGKVIYLGTFSKSIAPAIRISYMVLPEKLLEQYYEKCSFYVSTVSRIDQKVLEQFLTEGYYERHLNKMRSVYKGKQEILLAELKELGDICDISGENAGLHILLTFHNERTEKELIAAAEAENIKVYGVSQYYIAEKAEASKVILLLGYAVMSEEKIRNAAKQLVRIWKKI